MVKSKQAEPPVGMFASLKTPNFRRFFVGHLVSNCGNWATNIAIGLLVLERTDSGVALGILAICQYGPLLVVTPWSGLVVDRSNTRRLLLWTQILEMVQSAGLAVATVLVPDSLITFYAVALIGGCLLAFDNPARRSLINEMVDKDHIPNAVALSSTVNALSRTVGPLVAGSLITTVGYTWCFTFDAISYLVMVGALLRMRTEEMHLSEVVVRARRQVRAGLRYVMQVPTLRISCAILLVVGLASYNFTVVMPLFVKEGLHGTDTQYTLVYAALSVGGVIGTLLFARRPSVDLRIVVNTSLLLGSTLIVLSLMPNTGWACLIAAGVGAAAVSYFAATTSLAQLETRADMKGRVLALQTALQLGTTPIGGPLLGALADVAGGRAPVMVGGLAAAFAGLFGLGANRLLTRSSERHRRTTSKRELI